MELVHREDLAADAQGDLQPGLLQVAPVTAGVGRPRDEAAPVIEPEDH